MNGYKQRASCDAAGNVVGQLLRYYVGALGFGDEGIKLLRRSADDPRALNTRPKSLQMLSGVHHRGDYWNALQAGEKLKPSQIGLIIALEAKPDVSLLQLRSWLKTQSKLGIKIVVANRDGSFAVR